MKNNEEKENIFSNPVTTACLDGKVLYDHPFIFRESILAIQLPWKRSSSKELQIDICNLGDYNDNYLQFLLKDLLGDFQLTFDPKKKLYCLIFKK